jgi:3-oxoacyl-[acyl-carrier protein] reductase
VTPSPDLSRLTVLIAGASSQAGIATAEALTSAGARVIAVGSDATRLQRALGHLESADLRICDLTDFQAVQALAEELRTGGTAPDGMIHLVGGWRGGAGIAGQSDDDYAFLHRSVLTTLRNTSRAFIGDLTRSPRGRLAIVSATAVDSPTAGNASYAAIKAAAETWVRAVAQEFAAAEPQRAAAAIVVVKALLDDAMRAEHPERRFPGYTHVRDLAATMAGLFERDPADLNGRRLHPAG